MISLWSWSPTFEKTYSEISKVPMEPTCSPAPFRAKSVAECLGLVQAFVEDTRSGIGVEVFAILDERSREDDTVRIVKASQEQEISGLYAEP